MRVSQRSMDVSLAQTEISIMIMKAGQERGLTSIELLQAITQCQQSLLKHIRQVEDAHQEEDDGT